ncbi:hypothetical protein [Vibrio coralliilyticus]|uniref:hypothetical protein n=1 Tax=Vibrio coralliilyticus TaxID=190893 RepID=UPI00148E1F95|nr:hypothetical protein [Vibrio coralliilyticus]NOI27857.1 hypothetical protein [Vibrio coralliilyticus]NOI50819.1 hypothetical protein [Vibrio coralliilyticus]WFB49891.1 hypothetical protein P6988_23920 [Vibrio coralliilyticus]
MNKMALIGVASLLLSGSLGATTLHDIATKCAWEFSNADGEVLDPNVKLNWNGTLTYQNPNEASWDINDGDIIFRNNSGVITTRFTQVEIDASTSQLQLKGSNNWHILTCK